MRISRLLYPVYHRKLSRGVFIKELFCKRIVSLHKIDIISFFKFPLSIESKWGSWFHSLERKFSIDPFQMQILIEDVLQRLTKRSCNTNRARFVSLVPSLITVFHRVFIGTNSSLFIFCERIVSLHEITVRQRIFLNSSRDIGLFDYIVDENSPEKSNVPFVRKESYSGTLGQETEICGVSQPSAGNIREHIH